MPHEKKVPSNPISPEKTTGRLPTFFASFVTKNPHFGPFFSMGFNENKQPAGCQIWQPAGCFFFGQK